jgi:hypothetical protein
MEESKTEQEKGPKTTKFDVIDLERLNPHLEKSKQLCSFLEN